MTTIAITDLHADCSQCAALCCVLLPYRKDSGFGADKPGGVPCRHLLADDRCSIHDRLRSSGWSGCDVFDCFGAGQHVTRHTYTGRSWRDEGDRAPDRGEMGAVLSVVRLLHEMLHHLGEVAEWVRDERSMRLHERVLELRDLDPVALLTLDVDELHAEVGSLLSQVSAGIRRPAGADLAHHDLAGHDLRRRDLRNADLRGALLIAADLRGVDLGRTDLLGADLRDADLRGAHAEKALFLTTPQLAAARGDARTRIAPWLRPPGHWGSASAGAGER